MQYLLAVCALQGKLFLVAGQAVVVPLFLHKASDANRLLTAIAAEAVLMPAATFVLHLFGTCHKKQQSVWPGAGHTKSD